MRKGLLVERVCVARSSSGGSEQDGGICLEHVGSKDGTALPTHNLAMLKRPELTRPVRYVTRDFKSKRRKEESCCDEKGSEPCRKIRAAARRDAPVAESGRTASWGDSGDGEELLP